MKVVYQNYFMSQQSRKFYQRLSLHGLSTFNIPSISQLPNTGEDSLKFITTQKYIENGSNHFLYQQKDIHQQLQSQEQDSLAILLQKQEPATSSGKKKRVGCTCKKTFCLKMYCECFANSKTCSEDCVCCDCKNINQNKEIIKQAKENVKQKGIHSCEISEKRCNCKKSFCQKKYCECFNAGISCSDSCKCIECCNKQFVSEDKKRQGRSDVKQAIQHQSGLLRKSLENFQSV